MILIREVIWSDLCLLILVMLLRMEWMGRVRRQTIRTPVQLVSSNLVKTWTKAASGGKERKGATCELGSAFYRNTEYISRYTLGRKMI